MAQYSSILGCLHNQIINSKSYMLRIQVVPYLFVSCFSIGQRRNYNGIVGNFWIVRVRFWRTIWRIYYQLWFQTKRKIIFLYSSAASLLRFAAKNQSKLNSLNKEGIRIVQTQLRVFFFNSQVIFINSYSAYVGSKSLQQPIQIVYMSSMYWYFVYQFKMLASLPFSLELLVLSRFFYHWDSRPLLKSSAFAYLFYRRGSRINITDLMYYC